jgi:predicted TIM-barrel fold metal-dependent hydrolase
MIVDCQTHWYPPAYLELILDRPGFPSATRNGDGYVFYPRDGEPWPLPPHYTELTLQLEDASANGVDVVLSSPAVFGDVSRLPLPLAVEVAGLLNGELAQAERDHPGRVIGVATLPMQDAGAAVAELDRAVAELGLRAVCIHSSIAGARIGNRDTWPVYERIQEIGVPIFLHPTRSIAIELLQDNGLEGSLGAMFDTSVAALSLIYDGVLDAFPGLKVVHPHLGGMLPYVLGRVEEEDSKHWSGGRHADLKVSQYLRRNFLTDTVSQHPGALALAREVYGAENVLFSSDYPYWDRAKGVAFIRDNLDERDAAAVYSGNASRLLGLED